MTGDLATTNFWLAVIAAVSAVELLLIVTMSIVGFVLYRRATESMDRLETNYVAPLATQMGRMTGDAHDLMRRVQSLEERATAMMARVEDTASRLAAIAQRAWPVLGTWRAVAAAVGALRHNGRGTARHRRAAGLGPQPAVPRPGVHDEPEFWGA
jgi:hypothetical protein